MSQPRPLEFEIVGQDTRFSLDEFRLIVAGYTGRDAAAVQRHIDELAAIGVPPPEFVPAFFELDPGLATQDPTLRIDGANTSGEVEPVLIRHHGRLFLGVGSDHTDRDIERTSIALSKSACPKPLSSRVVEIGRDFDWDTATMRSAVDGVEYQRGSLSAVRPTTDVMDLFDAPEEDDLIIFGGTVPLLHGEFVAGQDWEVSLHLGNGSELRHEYRANRP